jgi:hypothetical protein
MTYYINFHFADDLIHLGQDWVQWLALVKKVVNLWVPYNS